MNLCVSMCALYGIKVRATTGFQMCFSCTKLQTVKSYNSSQLWHLRGN